MTKESRVPKAVFLSLAAFTVWVFSDTCAKITGQSVVPFVQILGLGSLSCMLTVLAWAALRGRLHVLRHPKAIKLHLARIALFFASSFACLASFTYLPLTTVYTVLFLAPLLIALVGARLMHEPVSRKQIGALCLGLAGVLIALHPSELPQGTNLELGLPSVFCFLAFFVAGALLARQGSIVGEAPETLAFYPQIAMTIGFLSWALFHFVPMEPRILIAILLQGFFAAIGWILYLHALSLAKANVVSAFHYSQIVTGALISALLWDQRPSLWLCLGAALIILASTLSARYAKTNEPALI